MIPNNRRKILNFLRGNNKGTAFLPIVLVVGAVVVEFVVAGAFLIYYLNSSNFGARLSAEAFSAASAGIEDALIKIVRDKNCPNVICVSPYTIEVGNRSAVVTICKDTCAGSGTHEITSVGRALTRRRQLVAVVETNSTTGEIRIISIKKAPL
jgi:hypothetical protein